MRALVSCVGAIVFALTGCDAPRSEPALRVGLPQQLASLTAAQQRDLSARITIPGILDEALAINDGATEAIGSFTLNGVEAEATHPFALTLTYEPDGERALLARLEGEITIALGRDNDIAPSAADFDTCGAVDGDKCALAFDLNKNGVTNLDDLVRGVEPFAAAPFVNVAPDDLPFPSGIQLGGFARQVVVIENLSERALRTTVSLVDAPGVTLSLYETEFNPENSAQRKLSLTLDPFEEALVAVSFAPVNPFLTVGDIFVEVVDDGANDPADPDVAGTTGVRQAQRIRIIANADGELQPPPPDFAPLNLAESADLRGLPPEAVESFNTASLFNGLPVSSLNSVAAPGQPGIPFSGRTVRALFRESGGDVDAAVPADAAFLVEIPPENKLSVSLSGIQSDVDMSVLVLDENDNITDIPDNNVRVQNAVDSPEALEIAPALVPRRALVVIGRVEPDVAVAAQALAPFSLSAHLTKTPEFTAPPNPISGPLEGGNRVVLQGRGFHPNAIVTFSDARAIDCTFTPDATDPARSTIACAAPPGSLLIGKNPATIVVANPGRDDGGDGQAATLPEGYAYEPPAPRLDTLTPAVAPSTGSGGAFIRIEGAFFSRRIAEPEVRFGDVVASGVVFRDSGLLEVPAPAHPAGIVSVTVRNVLDRQPGDPPELVRLSLPSNVRNFTYVTPDQPPPTVTSIEPARGAVDGGDSATVIGSAFQPGALVLVDSVAALETTFVSSTALTFKIPARLDPGFVDVAVVNPDGQRAELDDAFEYFVPDPRVDTVFPDEASVNGGTFVVINGAGFRAGVQVEFAQGAVLEVSPSVNRISTSTLLAATPVVDAAGEYTVTVRNLDGRTASFANTFRFVQPSGPPPRIDAISPNNGDKDLPPLVTLGGVEFRSPAVIVGAQNVPLEVVETLGEQDFVSFFPPVSADDGPVIIRLINDDGQSDTAIFNYTTSLGDAPVITSVTPGEARRGDVVTILGRDFDTLYGFGGAGDDTAELRIGPQTVIPTTVASNRLTAIIPNLDTLVGESGSVVAIEVTNIDGQSTSAGLVYVIDNGAAAPPSISAVSPQSAALGTRVTLSGANFNLSLLRVGNTVLSPASAAIVDNRANSIAFDLPDPGVPTPASVVLRVTNVDGQSAETTLVVTRPPPRIDVISPDEGDPAGGTPITLLGANFDGAATVRIAGAAVTPSARSATSLSVVAPASQTGEGTVSVTVTNTDGQVASASFRYREPSAAGGDPVIGLVAPTEVHALVAGDVVTLVGANLASVDTAVIERIGGTGPATFDATVVSVSDLALAVRLDDALPDTATSGATYRVVVRDVQLARSATSPPFAARAPRVSLTVEDLAPNGAGGELVLLGEFFHPDALASTATLDNGAGSVVDLAIDAASETFLSATIIDVVVPGSRYQLRLSYTDPVTNGAVNVDVEALAGAALVLPSLGFIADSSFVPSGSNLAGVTVSGDAPGSGAAGFGTPTTFDLLTFPGGARVAGGSWVKGTGDDVVLTFAATSALLAGVYSVRLSTNATTDLVFADAALTLEPRAVATVELEPLIVGAPNSGSGVFLAGDRIVADDGTRGVVLATAATGAVRPPDGVDVDGVFSASGAATANLAAGAWRLCAVGANDAARCPAGLSVVVEECANGLRASGLNSCGGVCNLAIEPGAACDDDDDLDDCADDTHVCVGANATVCADAGVDVDGDRFAPGDRSCNGDCNDGNANQSPADVEVCDTVDNNCDGVAEEGCPCEEFVFDFGASTTDWNDPLNWSPDGVPGTSPNHCPSIPAGRTASMPTTLANALRTLRVDGTLTHNNASVDGITLTITDTLTIGATGAIDVSGRGFGPASGGGAGTSGTACQCGNLLSGAGAGHGGFGGIANGSTSGGVTPGVLLDPDTLGSGGGNRACVGGPPGSGGGRVKIVVGTLEIDGAIIADGTAAQNDNAAHDGGAGGGSGGSIDITASLVTSSGGAPRMRANGGSGAIDACGGINGGGGGGGGRIALKGFAGALPAPLTFEAAGGLGAQSGQHGGAGLVITQPAGALPSLTSNNLNRSGATTPLPDNTDATLSSVVVGGNAVVEIAKPDDVLVADAITVQSSATLIVTEPLDVSTVVVDGLLRTLVATPDGVTIKCDNMTIGATGAIDVSGQGFAAGVGPGRGGNAGACQCGNILSGSGAGHGGTGGVAQGGNPGGGALYGALQGAPLDLGSGGGFRACGANFPGGGGGLVRLDVAQTLTVDGAIRANGVAAFGDTASTSGGEGGGSGGSIWIAASVVTTNGTPTISANGGAGGSDECGGINGGGGGGGGRVSLLADASTLPAGVVIANGGAGGAPSGGAGNPGIVFHFPGLDSLVTVIAPAFDATGDVDGTLLEWTGVGALGTRHYHIELDDDPHFDATANHPEDFEPPIAAVNENAGTPGGPLTVESFVTPPLEPQTRYFWRVVLHNSGNGVVGGSTISEFVTP